MGRAQDYLNEGNMTLLGGIVSELGLEWPDFNSTEEWESWLDELVEKHVVQSTKYSWIVVENKVSFRKYNIKCMIFIISFSYNKLRIYPKNFKYIMS